MIDGEKAFKYLWVLTHNHKVEDIPIKQTTIKLLLEWCLENFNKKTQAKLGLEVETKEKKEVGNKTIPNRKNI